MLQNDSNFLYKEACDGPKGCGSSDANAVYDDGHMHCFACGRHTPSEGEVSATPSKRKRVSGLITGEIEALDARNIREDTCKHFGYRIGKHNGKRVHIAPYHNAEGELVAQHLRTKDKEFPWLGDVKEALPFGSHCFQKSGKKLVLTEGEIDCMSMSQVQGNQWPVWSIGCGAGYNPNTGEADSKVPKYIAKHLDLFRGFEEVVIMFDMDKQGIACARAAAEVIGPTAKIAELPLHDPNEMLKAGRTKELIDAMWRARPYSPEGVVTLSDILDKALSPRVAGKSLALEPLSRATFGRRPGEVWVLGAGTGAGKTDFLLQDAAHAITVHEEAVGLFFLEATAEDIGIRLAGKIAKKTFHVPDGSWTEDERRKSLTDLANTGRVFLYNNFGISDWDRIKARIRFLAHNNGVRYFVVDNLSAFSAVADDERRELERVMSEACGVAQELGAFIWIVSHLNTPEGKPHEEGGRVMDRHLKGARAIAQWAFFILGIERNQQAEDEEERRTSLFRVLKDRVSGRATGFTTLARYDFKSGMLEEVQPTAEESGFKIGKNDDDEDDEEQPF